MTDTYSELEPLYSNGEIVGWKCNRCGWGTMRDNNLSEIDARAVAQAEFLDHTCVGSAGAVQGR